MARPPKFEDARPVKLTLTLHPVVRERLEKAAVLLSAREGKRLSLGDAIGILIDESDSLKQLVKLTARAKG